MSVVQLEQDCVYMDSTTVQPCKVMCQPYSNTVACSRRAADTARHNARTLHSHSPPNNARKKTKHKPLTVPILKRIRGQGKESTETFRIVSNEKNQTQNVVYQVFKHKEVVVDIESSSSTEILTCSKLAESACSLISEDTSAMNGSIPHAAPTTSYNHTVPACTEPDSAVHHLPAWITQPLQVGGEVVLDDRTHIETENESLVLHDQSLMPGSENTIAMPCQLSPCAFPLNSSSPCTSLDTAVQGGDVGDLPCSATILDETASMHCDTDTSYYLCIDSNTGRLLYVDEAELPTQGVIGKCVNRQSSQDTCDVAAVNTQQQSNPVDLPLTTGVTEQIDGSILADVGAETVVVTTVIPCDKHPISVSSNCHASQAVQVVHADALTLSEHCDADTAQANLWIPSDNTSEAERSLLEVSLPHILCTDDTAAMTGLLTGLQQGEPTIREISKRERDKSAKRKLRENMEFRLKERASAKERMSALRSDPEWRQRERDKDRLRRRQSRVRNINQRNHERERDKLCKRQNYKIITQCQDLGDVEPICSDTNFINHGVGTDALHTQPTADSTNAQFKTELNYDL